MQLTSQGDSAGAGGGPEHPGLKSALDYETRNCSLFPNTPLLSGVVLHPGMPALASFHALLGFVSLLVSLREAIYLQPFSSPEPVLDWI